MVINLTLVAIVYVRSPKTLLVRFYAVSTLSLVFLGLGGFALTYFTRSLAQKLLMYIVFLLYAIFPFLFMHFIAIFTHRAEIVRSRLVLFAIYGTGLFAYVMMLLNRLPVPITDDGIITQSAIVYFVTWMSIFFSIGIAILYDSYSRFREKTLKTNVLFVSFMLLLLLLPGPFTESLVFRIGNMSFNGYFYICTLGLIIGIYFIFRFRIVTNTMYDALKSALSVMNDLLVTTNDQFQITLVRGRAVSSLLGYEEKDLLGQPLSTLVTDKNYLEEYRGYVLEGRMRECYFDAEVQGKTGTRYPMNFSFTPMEMENEVTGFVGVGRDMRERKKLEAELLQAQKMESLGTLAGGIAHDFNNILQIILMNTLSLSNKKLSEERIQHIVDVNKNAVQRGASLVQQILTFARKTEVHFKPLSANALLEELTKMLNETFPRMVVIKLELDPSTPIILADQTQMHQVLLNLCVNARDAMPDGGTITLKTDVIAGERIRELFPAASEDNYVRLVVSDTGHGMEENVRSKIFEPFFTTKSKEKGTGLGLSVVYGIVSTHHGFIDVESSVGHGSIFHVYIPLSSRGETRVGAPETARKVVQEGSETILIVEDEEFLRDSLKSLLKSAGYSVITADDGYDALAVFYKHKNDIDLVVTDLGLPKLNGWDAVLKMREVRPDLKAVISSGYLDPEFKSESGEVEGFILKPFNPTDILHIVRKSLDGKRKTAVKTG